MHKLDKIWTLFILWRWQTGQKGGRGRWGWSFTITRGWCQEGFQSGRREKASTWGIIGTKHSAAKLFLNGVTLSKGSWPNSFSESNATSLKLSATGGSHTAPLWSGWDFQLLHWRDVQTLRHCGSNHKICQHSCKVTYKSISARLSFRTWGTSLNYPRKWQKCEGQPPVEAFCPQWKDAVRCSFSSAGIFARVRTLSVVLANIWLKQTDIWAGKRACDSVWNHLSRCLNSSPAADLCGEISR